MAENDTEEAVNTDNDENEAVESTDANDEENGLISDSGDDGSKNKINPEVLQGIPVTISVEVGKTSDIFINLQKIQTIIKPKYLSHQNDQY